MTPTPRRPVPHTAPTSVLLHLAASAVLAIVPCQLGILLGHARGPGRERDEAATTFRERLELRSTAGWTAVAVLSAAAIFAATAAVSSWGRAAVWSWWLGSWRVSLGTGGGFTTSALVATAVLLLVGTVVR